MNNHLIDWQDFAKIDMRVGQILAAKLNPQAKIPAYVLTIDFGSELGVKLSSAQLTDNYSENELINRKIIAVISFPAKRIAGIKSEVLVLASVCPTNGTLLLNPAESALLGSKIA